MLDFGCYDDVPGMIVDQEGDEGNVVASPLHQMKMAIPPSGLKRRDGGSQNPFNINEGGQTRKIPRRRSREPELSSIR